MKATRKLFASVFVVSLLMALVLGAVLAWTGSTPTSTQSATAGSVSVALWWSSGDTGAKVIPTNSWIEVAKAGITNNGDIAVNVKASPAGSVSNFSGGGACNDDMSGQVVQLSGATVNPSASVASLVSVQLAMGTGAEDACQGSTISYDVTINVET